MTGTQPPTGANGAATDNPYVGPRSFAYGEQLFGRDAQVRELLDVFIAERLVLLHSASGAGKTSLINAGLRPALETEGFRVWPVIRVGHPLPVDASTAGHPNRFVMSVLASLEQNVANAEPLSVRDLAGLTIHEYLERRCAETVANAPDAGDAGGDVLIFDQFEEILRLAPTDREAKRLFFKQIGSALRDRHWWAIFAMREEFVGALDPYLGYLPSRLGVRYRLDLLDESGAREAIQKPAALAGVDFTDAAATRLIDNLRTVHLRGDDGGVGEALGHEVEPVHLQIVCHRLWNQPRPIPSQITPDAIMAGEGVDAALGDYYTERVTLVARETNTSEREIRDWFDRRLLTEQGMRGQVSSNESEGPSNDVIGRLVDAHLVRAEERRGENWFELAHDRLIGPVRRANAAWYAATLISFQRIAEKWEANRQPSSMLLVRSEIEEFTRWAVDNQLTPIEQSFLDKSRLAYLAARRTRRLHAAVVGVVAVSIVAIGGVLTWAAWKDRVAAQLARRSERLAHARQLSADAVTLAGDRLDLAFLLASEAAALDGRVDIRASLLSGFTGHASGFLHGHTGGVRSVAFSPNGGRILASGGEDGTIRIWDLEVANALRYAPLAGHEGGVYSVTFNKPGDLLASTGEDGQIVLWDLASGTVRRKISEPTGRTVYSVAFSPDGRVLASGGDDGELKLWDLKGGAAPRLLRGHSGPVYRVAFNASGVLASAGRDGTVRLWNRGQGQEPTLLVGHTDEVLSLAFSPDGKLLASGGTANEIAIWDVAKGKQKGPWLMKHTSSVFALAFSTDSQTLASGSTDKSLYLWNVDTGTYTETLTGFVDAIYSLAFREDGTVASGSATGPVVLWDARGYQELGSSLFSSSDESTPEIPGTGMAISHDGKLLAVPSCDPPAASVVLWDLPLPSLGIARSAGKPRRLELPATSDCRSSIAFNADNTLVALGQGKGDVLLWEPHSQVEPARLSGHAGAVTNVAFEPKGTLLAAASCAKTDSSNQCVEGEIRLWSVATRHLASVLKTAGGEVYALAFSPDGRLLAYASGGPSVVLVSVANPLEMARLSGSHTRAVTSLAFSPDGRWLASGSADASIIVSNVQEPAMAPSKLTKHRSPVWSVAFNLDSTMLASTGYDGQILLWDVATWHAMEVGRLDKEKIEVAFTPDGRTLVSRQTGGRAILWDVDPESWKMRACQIAGRNLTNEEWERYMANQEYHPTCASATLKEADTATLTGATEEARAKFKQVTTVARNTTDLVLNNHTCWYGTLDNYADVVLPACDRAVELKPDDVDLQALVREGRGLARAVVKDFKGAQADLEFFLANFKAVDDKAARTKRERESWLAAIRQGRNPIDAAALKALRAE